MNYPEVAQPLRSNDAKLGGKYRMNNIRGFIALSYLLYFYSGKQSSVDYSNGKEKTNNLQLKEEYESKICSFLGEDIKSTLSSNPLLAGQFEYILVAMERVFCLGSVEFNNKSYNNSKERTGGIRYPKTLLFSTNMLVLDLIISGFKESDIKTSLKAWLQNQKSSVLEFESKITQFLTVISEFSLFRTRTSESNEVIYRPIGIYERILTSGDVSIVDSKEQAGTSSIYNNVLKEELNPWLDSRRTNNITFKRGMNIMPYLEMLRTTMDIVRVSELEVTSKEVGRTVENVDISDSSSLSTSSLQETIHSPALRTKPFMLLAGISGTGKSRIVKEMAFQTCPNEDGLQDDAVTPGNYCLVEVKPNWHDSTELLGYKSVLTEHYVATKFVKFLAKAMCHPDVPFFVCLDEMNLAPVEQYFAEFLSVLESRKKGDDDKITSEPLIPASVFCDDEEHLYNALFGPSTTIEEGVQMTFVGQESQVYETLKRDGLRIPSNLIVVGTVNMDETTHQFSRKVIDRAMTIEMNIEDGDAPFKEFFNTDGDLKYSSTPISKEVFLSRYVTAKQAIEELNGEDQKMLCDEVPNILAGINKALDGTPFKVAYRVQNELIIYFAELRRFNTGAKAEELLTQAIDDILMMKVLPRVEGDNDLLEEPLKELAKLAEGRYLKAHQKVEEMQIRLDKNHFTSFWP